MKPVLATDDEVGYLAAWERLEQNGIPVFEPSKHADLPGFMVGPRARVLCVWLDHQYDDAVNLIRDPNYVVKHPVDPEEFDRIYAQVSNQMAEATDRGTEQVINYIVVGCASLALAAGVYVAFIK